MALNVGRDASFITCRTGKEYGGKAGEVNSTRGYKTDDTFSQIHNECNTSTYQYILDIVKYRSIARKRLGKHIPAGTNARNNRTSIVRQRITKHA
jgi:hypothetical protein